MPQTLTEIATFNSSSSIGDALREGGEVLAAAGVENPRRDAEALLAHCLKVESWRLLLEREKVLTPGEEAEFQTLREARRARRPLAYIRGWTGFHDLVLACDPRALVPRPETEILVEEALRFLAGTASPEVIEIGCGTGAVALALARQLPGAVIGASDISPAALELARENAARLGLLEKVDLRLGDLFAPWADRRGGGVDLVVANPPYLSRQELAAAPPEVREFEPRAALDGGEDGLEIIRRLAAEAPFYLKPGGRLMIEIGASQGAVVRRLADPADPVIARRPNGVRAAKQSSLRIRYRPLEAGGDCFAPSALAMTESGAGGTESGAEGWEFIELVKDYSGRDRVAVFGRRDG